MIIRYSKKLLVEALLLCIVPVFILCMKVSASSPAWHWVNPKPQGNSLQSVWCAAADDAWAVGNYVIMHWDGCEWVIHSSDTSWHLTSIIGFSEDDIWVSGSMLLHWDGAAWQVVTLEPSVNLGPVWGFRNDDIWLGTSERGMLYHFDGSGWDLLDTGTGRNFKGFWGAAADDIWAFGDQGTLLHWNGAIWSEYLDTGFSFSDIHGFSATDIRVIGYASPPDQYPMYGLVMKWDGTGWEIEQGWLDPEIWCIWGAAPDDAWIGGSVNGMYHWDGEEWRLEEPDSGWPLYDMDGTSGTDIRSCGAHGTLVHRNGSGWQADHSGSPATVYDICSLSPWDAWSVRENASVGISSVHHWDGSRWHQVLEAPGMFSAVDARESTVWVAGYDSCWSWNGDVWVNHLFDFDCWIETIHVFGETNVIAQGYHDLFQWDGVAWSSVARFDAEILTMFCLDTDDIWVGGESEIGNSGVLQHWNGSEWSQTVETPLVVSAIWGPAPDDLWAVGSSWSSDAGMVLRWDGTQWYPHPAEPLPVEPQSIWGSSSDDVWVVSLRHTYGGLYHWNGIAWAEIDIIGIVTEITGSGPEDMWSYGDHGAVMHYPDDPTIPSVQLDLEMPGAEIAPGDTFYLHACTRSTIGKTVVCRLFVALAWAGQYWFYPGWLPYYPDHRLDYETISVIDETNVLIPEFTWPDTGVPILEAAFIGACTDPDYGNLISDVAMVEFVCNP